ncbi:MAG: cytochrome c1 [Thiothrix sp.]|nr:cytochrome c1 [Thiothrix sp.]HPQ95293.1 cytochrome c1 [Thiolinea sp.]
MKNTIAGILFALGAVMLPLSAGHAAEEVALQHADIDVHNEQSLQRGAKYFVNYCMGCHSLNFSRYNRVGLDLGLTDEQVADNLIFTRTDGEPTKVGELMKNGMTAKYGSEAFGNAPPDLSLTGRSRGPDWIYSFLKSFYLDPSRPLGVNNTVFANAGMPHVLWELQGYQTLEHAAEGADAHAEPKLVLEQEGTASPAEYDQIVRDLTNFLTYVGEPAQLHRRGIGVWVLIYLGLFAVFAYFLKKEYWKDVH